MNETNLLYIETLKKKKTRTEYFYVHEKNHTLENDMYYNLQH